MSKQEKKLMDTSNVVVSTDVHRLDVWNLFSKLAHLSRKGAIITATVVVVIIVGGIVIWWHASQAPKLTGAALTVQVNKDISNKEYSAAIKSIKAAPDQGEATQLLLASVYNNQGNYKLALQVFRQLIKEHGVTLGWAISAAQAAESAKDYSQAVSYYKQAETLSQQDKNNVVAGADKRYYDSKIQELQKKL